MGSKHVKLTVPEKLYKESLQIVREFGYSNVQDLTVESLRKQIIELKKQQALFSLEKNLGSVKGKKRLARHQKESIAKKHTSKRAKEISRKYGL